MESQSLSFEKSIEVVNDYTEKAYGQPDTRIYEEDYVFLKASRYDAKKAVKLKLKYQNLEVEDMHRRFEK